MPNEDNNNKNKEQKDDEVQPDQQFVLKKSNVVEAINNNDVSGDQIKRDENPFSLKHFLKKDSTSSGGGGVSGSVDSGISTGPKVTGARPKIPLNSSSADVDGKMKRSPRFFKYFDSAVLSDGPAYRSNIDGENINASTSNILYEPYHSSFSNETTNNLTKENEDESQHKSLFQRSHSTYNLPNQKYSQSSGVRRRKQHEINSNFNKTVSPEISMALPDFVQDHIALEMFYSRGNGSSNISPLSFEYDHLPDFAINENESNSRVLPDTAKEANMAFDLMCNSPEKVRNSVEQIPLDLPPTSPPSSAMTAELTRNNQGIRSTNDIPLDLTARNNGFGSLDHPGHLSNVETFQTLPDFLSDGHIHSSGRQSDNGLENFDDSANESLIQSQQLQRVRLENVRLRQELDNSNRISDEQSRRIHELETTIERMRNIESAYSDNLVQNMEKVEENIKRSNNKAAAAQSNVVDLKKKIKQLTAQIEILRQENEFLKEGGAVGGESFRTHASDRNHQYREISSDLMAAASNAESHLRQLLSGVENLRLLATQIESINNVIVSSDDFSDCEDDFTGPAL